MRLIDIEAVAQNLLQLRPRNPREGKALAARADRIEYAIAVRTQKDQQGLSCRLLQGLQQRIAGREVQLVGRFDQADLPGTFQWMEGELPLQSSDLIDFNRGSFRLEKMKVRMIVMINLSTGHAVAATGSIYAEEMADQGQRHQPFTRPLRPFEEVCMGQTPRFDSAAQDAFLPFMADDMIVIHGMGPRISASTASRIRDSTSGTEPSASTTRKRRCCSARCRYPSRTLR